MQSKWMLVPIVASGLFITSGCKSLLPRETCRFQTPWTNFSQADAAFEKIIPFQSREADLRRLGFDPYATPNVKILTYLDVMNRFLPNPAICKEDLHEAVRKCLECKDACRAYEMELSITNSHRYGSITMDVLGFKRRTKVTGWTFKGLVLMQNDLVVYKLRSGEPAVERYEEKDKPLGPLQELDHVLVGSMPRPH
ncbi:MAG: hypothetical protein C5B50_12505 [Verrucomicrobia bacterium]|nr:MAG: hypothetical protein C5B50_12505 [Verrucomicrobiota bacterium]